MKCTSAAREVFTNLSVPSVFSTLFILIISILAIIQDESKCLALPASTVSNDANNVVPMDVNLIDLTYPLNSNTLHWLTARPFEMKVKHNGTVTSLTSGAAFHYQMEEIELATHTGTHLDAPCHFSLGKWCVSDIPIEHLMNRPVAMVDVSRECILNRTYQISISDIEKNEAIHGRITDGSVVMFKTGWSRFWPIKEEYFGTDTNDPSQARFPGISSTASTWLAENRVIVGVAIEGPSVDPARSESHETHVKLFDRNIYAIENVPNLHRIPPRGATVTVVPLKLEKASGSPVRMIANLTASPYNRQSMFSSLMPYSNGHGGQFSEFAVNYLAFVSLVTSFVLSRSM